MSEEKRKLGDYEIIQSIYIGDKEVVFGVDKKDPYPFMVCCCDYHNPLSAAWPTEGVASDDYLEAMQIFVDRVQSQIDLTKEELAKFTFDKTVFTKEHTVLPFGVRKIDALRTLTTESLAVFIPFRVQEIYHENGVYYGQNVISKNMIIANRRHLLNGNSFILRVSGAGKSFTAKEEMTNIILTDPNADIIIIDPEREYSPLVKAMQGEVIHISATSENHINAMDMNSDYGDGANPVILKSEFILSLCEQLIGGSSLGAKQKSIIDRCTASVYRYYQQGNYMGTPPTLQDFREELLKQDEPEAQEIALAIELFTDGSLNTFAKHTNVDTHSRLICYDILDLGKQLQPIGMLVVLDSILNRITQNRAKGRNTFIFIDEIYLLFQHEYSANFLFTLWKRVRKYGAYCTDITQNVDVRPDRALCKAV